ncbi:hypothetical protein SUGI_0094350 [Cryptomeria japonica]|nr:hypothetical protein SUGI_0094350 [Cryptomeria japonica]
MESSSSSRHQNQEFNAFDGIEYEYFCLKDMKCLERITFDRNVIEQCFELDGCQNLKTAKFGHEKLVELIIQGFPELMEMPDFRGPSCIESIIIDRCKIQYIRLSDCQNLRSILGISDLAKLVELEISGCGKLEFESLCLRGMKCLERIEFDRNVIVKCFQLDGCQNLKTAKFGHEKLVELIIQGCPELMEMPAFRDLSSLERIIIDGCGFKDLQLYRCQNVRTVLSDKFQFTGLYIQDCPELEELSSLPRLSSLKEIVIDSCEKLENTGIAGIEELHVQEYMGLRYCSNAIIRSCIHKLKSVATIGMDMIGRAVDKADSRISENLFSEANIGVHGLIKIGPDESYRKRSELSFVIGCFVVVVDSSTLAEDINKSPRVCNFNVRQGEWIITTVTHDHLNYYNSLTITEEFLKGHGIMKKGFRVEVKKGEEWKGMGVLSTIVDKLYIASGQN